MTIPFTLNPMIVSTSVLIGLIAGGIVLLRSRFLFVTVQGRSMAPTLQPQDHVLVLRMRATKKIKKGAIVLLDASAARNLLQSAARRLPPPAVQHLAPANAPLIKRVAAAAGKTSFIKRVVAVAGETYIDTHIDPGTSVPLKSVEKPSPLNETICWHIPPGMVFVCGDNLAASFDSRTWGPVPLNVIQGVVIHHFKKQTP